MFNQLKLKKITLIIFAVGMSQKLIANECDHYREEIEYYQHLRGIGGNADVAGPAIGQQGGGGEELGHAASCRARPRKR